MPVFGSVPDWIESVGSALDIVLAASGCYEWMPFEDESIASGTDWMRR